MCDFRCVVVVILLIAFMLALSLVMDNGNSSHTSLGNNEGGHANKTASSCQLMSNVCSRTSDPPFCLKSLQSDHRIATDIPHLIRVTLDLTVSDGNNTRHKITTLLLNPKIDSRVNKSLTNCAVRYDAAINYLKEGALDDLPKHHFESIKTKAAAVVHVPLSCEDGFKQKPSPLSQENHNFQKLCEILGTIVNFL